MSQFSVRAANLEDYTEIIKESGKDIITPFSDTFYVISYEQHRLLFSIKPIFLGVYEVHIVCPKESILASRLLALAVMDWAHSVYPEVKALVTSCPKGKIANLVKKLGFKQFDNEQFIYVY